MSVYDVFIRDGNEYGGGFEVRIPGVDSEAEAIDEAVAASNVEVGEAMYDASDVGSVRRVDA